MKVLLVNYFGLKEGGGGEVNTLMIAKALEKSNAKVVIASTGGFENLKTLKFRPFALKTFGAQEKYLKEFLKRAIESEKPDIIHSMDRLSCVASVLAAKECKRPVVVSFNDHWFICPKSTCVDHRGMKCAECSVLKLSKCFPGPRFLWELYKLSVIGRALRIVKKAEALTAVGMPLVSKLESLGVQAEILPNFVDLKQFARAKPDSKLKKIRKKKILFAGRLSHERGVDVLTQTARLVLEKNKDCCFIIAGDGELKGKITELQKQFPENIAFLGKLSFEKLLQAYKAADAVIIPAILDEPFGRTMIEAMAAGKPAIASSIGNYKEVIADGKNGLLAEAGNPKAFAKAVSSLLSSKKLAGKIRREGLKTVRQKYSESTVSKKLLGIYRKAARRNFQLTE